MNERVSGACAGLVCNFEGALGSYEIACQYINDASRADPMRIRVNQFCPCFSATCLSTHVHMEVVI